MTHCKSCQAPVIWATTLRGRPIPLEGEPDEDGTFVLEPGQHTSTPLAVPYQALIHRGRDRYSAHFRSCPHARAWRRG